MLLVVFSSVICIVFLDVFAWWQTSKIWQQAQDLQSLQTKAADDTRKHYEVINDLKDKGVPSSRILPFKHMIRLNDQLNGGAYVPLAGVSNITTVFCNDVGKYEIYLSDQYGFRNPANIAQRETVDIALIGDSFTHGHCVDEDATIPGVIRETFPHTLNFGITGSGPLAHLGKIKEYALPKRPKLVIWVHFEGNDLDDLNNEREVPALLAYLQKGYTKGLPGMQQAIDRDLMAMYSKLYSDEAIRHQKKKERQGEQDSTYTESLNFIKDLIRIRHLRSYLSLIFSFWQYSPHLDLYAEAMKAAKSEIEAVGGEMYFVYLPAWQRFKFGNVRSYHREDVLNIAKNLDLTIIDVLPEFERHKEPLSLFPYGFKRHYNEQGYKIVGDAIVDKIIKDEPLALKLNL